MYDAIEERITAYEQEILTKLATMELEEHPGGAVPPVKNLEKARRLRSGDKSRCAKLCTE